MSVDRLGWTLLHFLWQGLSIAVLYAVVRTLMRAARPQARYLLACAALAAMMAAPVATWVTLRPSSRPADAASRPPASINPVQPAAVPLPPAMGVPVPVRQPSQLLPLVVMLWLAGVIVFWARLAGAWMLAARMRSVQVRPAPPEWQDALSRLGARIGVTRPVRLLVSALVQTPAVVGWLRPVVLVPVGALSGLPAGYLEALLLHELAHIRRHDYLVNMIQSVAEAMLFYHPAVWWVSAHIRTERELCCDDVVVASSGDALTYARALAQLESFRPAHLTAALAANSGSLPHRIARLLGQSRPPARTGLGPGVFAVAILLAAAAYGVFAQPAAPPTFQTVSIKLNTSRWSDPTRHPMGVGIAGKVIAEDASLKLLIQFAYADHDAPHWLPLLASRVIGGPAWVDSQRYDINAIPRGDTDPQQRWRMLRTLLADRFHLQLHRETRDLPAYDLTVAGGGPKLPAAKKVGCVSFGPGNPPRRVPGKVDCGYVGGGAWSTGMHLQGGRVHVSDLARELAMVLDRPVLDKTGFTAEFDLDFRFIADEATRGLPHFPYPRPLDPNGSPIFAALEQQLGLKLVPVRTQVEVLVVDHAETPASN